MNTNDRSIAAAILNGERSPTQVEMLQFQADMWRTRCSQLEDRVRELESERDRAIDERDRITRLWDRSRGMI